MTMGKVTKIAVEANIGTGKSHFLKLLGEWNENLTICSEPVMQWQDVSTEPALNFDEQVVPTKEHDESEENNILKLFYREPQRWTFSFQCYAMSTSQAHFKNCVKHCNTPPNGKPVVVSERSLLSGRWVFADYFRQKGIMSELEWQMYRQIHTTISTGSSHTMIPHGVIYLRAPPETSFSRISSRSRNEEEGVCKDRGLTNYRE